MQAPRVFLVQEPPQVIQRSTGNKVPRDMSSAQRYGTLTPILDSNHQSSALPGPTLMELSRALADFDPASDFLCFAGGDPMSLALAMLALRSMNHDDVRVLRWERERALDGTRGTVGFYVPVTTPLRAH